MPWKSRWKGLEGRITRSEGLVRAVTWHVIYFKKITAALWNIDCRGHRTMKSVRQLVE